jgi:hypothetical protein
MRHGTRFFIVIAALAAGTIAGAGFAFRQDLRDAYAKWRRGPVPEAVSREEFLALAEEEAPSAEDDLPEPREEEPAEAPPSPVPDGAGSPEPQPAPEPRALPASMNLKVLFVPQAPFKVWDPLHEDACEEASMIMLQTYAEGTASLSVEEMDARIYDLVGYEEERGLGPSITAEQTAEVMRARLGLDAKVVPLASIDDLKRRLAAGTPVILPAAGKLLFNPNFRNGGPVYHMLVAKGYVDGRIVTNDPGTRLGADYVYDEDVLWNAVADWTGDGVDPSRKVMIVVEE